MTIRNPNTYYAVDRKRGLLFKFRHRDHRKQMIRDNPSLKAITSVTYLELQRKHTFTVQDFTNGQSATPRATPNIVDIAQAVAEALKPYMRKPDTTIAGEQPKASRTGSEH
jgi:hypothetical protein